MRKPNYLQIKLISGRVNEDIWMRYEDVENIFLLGQKLDESSSSQNLVDKYHKLHSEINEKLINLVKRVDYLNNL